MGEGNWEGSGPGDQGPWGLGPNKQENNESIKETGIKVWVLTGDKVETAINIGYSCGLLNNDMEQFLINTGDVIEI